ncbi:hypothetical protein BaRGS_00020846, partial [Batillaria attramentaria]
LNVTGQKRTAAGGEKSKRNDNITQLALTPFHLIHKITVGTENTRHPALSNVTAAAVVPRHQREGTTLLQLWYHVIRGKARHCCSCGTTSSEGRHDTAKRSSARCSVHNYLCNGQVVATGMRRCPKEKLIQYSAQNQ